MMSTKAEQPVAPPEGAILLTLEEAAHVMRCSVSHVRREHARGMLAFRKSGRKTFVHRDDITAYFEAGREELRRESGEEVRPLSRTGISWKAAGLIGDDDFGYKGRGKKKA